LSVICMVRLGMQDNSARVKSRIIAIWTKGENKAKLKVWRHSLLSGS
jgi:hypothetical protein